MLIPINALQAVASATSTDDTRYRLSAIHVQPAGDADAPCTLTATDGFLLLRTTFTPIPDAEFPAINGTKDHTGTVGPFLIPAELAGKLAKVCPKRSPIPVLRTIRASQNGDPAQITLSATDLEAPSSAMIDTAENGDPARFPETDRVIPKADPTHRMTIGAPILKQLLKAAAAINAKGVCFEFYRQTFDQKIPALAVGPIGVSLAGPDGPCVTGVLMPMLP